MKQLRSFLFLAFLGYASTMPAAPSATTASPTSITPTSAIFNGSVIPHGGDTDVYFEWGTSASYGNTTASLSLNNGNAAVPVNMQVNSLVSGTSYHYRTVATNRQGVAYGADVSFSSALFAAATTLAATDITPQSTTLNGTFAANGNDTIGYFEWGTSNGYGNVIGQTNLSSSAAPVASSVSLEGLLPSTTYYYRAVATNRFGIIFGDEMSFTTATFVKATTLAATEVRGQTATLNGFVLPNDTETSAWFEWGTTTNYGSQTLTTNVGSGGVVTVAIGITGLDFATTYFVRIVASNRFSVVSGDPVSFTTQSLPSATTLGSSGVTINSALLNGIASAHGNDTTVYFEWGTDASFGYQTTPELVTSNDVPVKATLVDLLPGNTYSFRLIASNNIGVAFGAVQQLTCLRLPIATTGSATDKTNASASIHGVVTANGLESAAYFEWGPTTNYGFQTAIEIIAANDTNVTTSAVISNLSVQTIYYFRLVVTNLAGTALGDGASFVAPGPIAITESALEVRAASAKLQASVNANGEETYALFEWGITTNYDVSVGWQFVGAGFDPEPLSYDLVGLAANTTYHYRITATNVSGVAIGQDVQFTTTGEPVAYTRSSLLQPGGIIVFRGDALPNELDASAFFRWGTNSVLLTNVTSTQTLLAGTNSVPLSATASNMPIGKWVYHQIVASNELGTAYGSVYATFVADIPTILSTTVAHITSNSAYFFASVSTYVYGYGCFEYGPTSNYGSRTPSTYLSGTGAPINYSNLVFSLQPGTIYHFRAVATNSVGTNYSADQTFLTRADPIVTITGATFVGPTNATLGGTVNPNGLSTTAYMEYGLSTNYGNFTTFTNLGTNKFSIPLSQTVTSLSPGLVYNYRIVAANASGTTYSTNRSFSTSPVFTNAYIFGPFPASLQYGGSAVADFNNDGKLDVIFTGNSNGIPITSIWLNSHNSADPKTAGIVFTNLNAGLPPLVYSSVACADFNNDGRIDIALNGRTNSASATGLTRIYRNDGAGVFTDIGAGLPGMFSGSVSWCDFNNDGKMDLFVSGATNSGYPSYAISQLYRNNGNDTFSAVNSMLPVLASNAVWDDYNNDGYPDVALSGTDARVLTNFSAVFRNLGNGTFTNSGNFSSYISTMAWGDFDADGKSDLFISGATNLPNYPYSTSWTRIFRNNGTSFVDFGASITNFKTTRAAWGDYNADGLPDILYSGDPGFQVYPPQRTSLFGAIPGGNFFECSSGITNIVAEGVNWADFDADGKLDVFIAGKGYYSGFIGAYRNLTTASNTPPTAPTGLNMFSVGNRAIFQWNPATDAQTPSAGLTYNLRIGTTPGGDQIVSSLAHINGTRRIAAGGNVGHVRIWTINDLPNSGTFYWSVQAIDNSFAGSPFAAEQKFIISGAPTINVGTISNLTGMSATLRAFIDANGFVTGGRFEWGTTTAYGNTSSFSGLATNASYSLVSAAASGLSPGTIYHWRVVATNSAGTVATPDQVFTTLTGPTITSQWAMNITTNSATLKATVNPNGVATAVRFRYGTSTNLGSTSPITTIGGTNGVVVNFTIFGLEPGTTYYYCTVATNGSASVTWTNSTFVTLAQPWLAPMSGSIGNGVFAFELYGTSGVGYDVYASSNLVNWVFLQRVTADMSGVGLFEDLTATNESRFYRISGPSVLFPP